jgi:hypothetical protein
MSRGRDRASGYARLISKDQPQSMYRDQAADRWKGSLHRSRLGGCARLVGPCSSRRRRYFFIVLRFNKCGGTKRLNNGPKSSKSGQPEDCKPDLVLMTAEYCWRKILVFFRQVRRRRAVGWTGKYPAGALAIGGFGRRRWGLRRTRGSLWDLHGGLEFCSCAGWADGQCE